MHPAYEAGDPRRARQASPRAATSTRARSRSTGACTCRTALAEAEVEYEDETSPVHLRQVRAHRPRDVAGARARRPAHASLRRHLDDHALDAAGQPGHRRPPRVRLRRRRYRTRRRQTNPASWPRNSRTTSLRAACRSRTFEDHRQVRAARSSKGLQYQPPVHRPRVARRTGRRTSRSTTAPAASTPRPATARRTSSTGQRYGLDILSPVDGDGLFTDGSRRVRAGMNVFEANPKIVAKLDELGVLLLPEQIHALLPALLALQEAGHLPRHRAVVRRMEHDDLRKRTLDAINSVHVDPRVGRATASTSMVETGPTGASRASAPGACRSRRSTAPSAASRCSTHRLSATCATIFRREGRRRLVSDGRRRTSCRPARQVRQVRRRPTSRRRTTSSTCGSSPAPATARSCSNTPRTLASPADLYLEGTDQHRGWFQLSLLAVRRARADVSPFKRCITHGFVVDSEGKKMSKSLGNFVSVADVIKSVGVDIFRLWISSIDYMDHIRVSLDIINKSGDAYRKIRNNFKFILQNVADFDPAADAVPAGRNARNRPLGAQRTAPTALKKSRSITRRRSSTNSSRPCTSSASSS